MNKQLLPNELLFKILNNGARNLSYCNSQLYNESIKLYGQCDDCNCINFPQLYGIRCKCLGFGKCMKCINKTIFNEKKIVGYNSMTKNFDIEIKLHLCFICREILCNNCKNNRVYFASNAGYGVNTTICNNCINNPTYKIYFRCCAYRCEYPAENMCNYKTLEGININCNKLYCSIHIKDKSYDSYKNINICVYCKRKEAYINDKKKNQKIE